MPGPGFVTRSRCLSADRGFGSAEMTAMSTDTDTIGSAAADAVSAPLDLLLTDAAFGALRRVNPGGFGLRFTDPGWIGNPLLRRVAHLAAAHIYRGGHLELTADATSMAPMVKGFPTAETRRG